MQNFSIYFDIIVQIFNIKLNYLWIFPKFFKLQLVFPKYKGLPKKPGLRVVCSSDSLCQCTVNRKLLILSTMRVWIVRQSVQFFILKKKVSLPGFEHRTPVLRPVRTLTTTPSVLVPDYYLLPFDYIVLVT